MINEAKLILDDADERAIMGVMVPIYVLRHLVGESEKWKEKEFQACSKHHEYHEEIERLENALKEIAEYWNRDQNENAMTDACWKVIEIAEEALKEKVFTNMSKRAADMLRDDMEAAPTAKVSDVEAAQKEVLVIARRLADSGEISLGGGGGDDLV